RVLLRALAHAPWARARWTPLTAPGYTDDRKNRTLARCREFLANVPSPKQKSRSSPSTGRHHGARTRIDLGEDCRGADAAAKADGQRGAAAARVHSGPKPNSVRPLQRRRADRCR